MQLTRGGTEVRFARAQGRLLYEARQMQEMTRTQLAEYSGVHPQQIFRIEMGEATARAYDVARLARVLRVPLWQVFPEVPEALPARAPLQVASSAEMAL